VTKTPHPKIALRAEWLAARKKHLLHEKKLTAEKGKVNAERRRLPMVKLDKDYVFDGHRGKESLRDLFDGRRQLIVYHFIFDPEWEKGVRAARVTSTRSVICRCCAIATRISLLSHARRWPSWKLTGR
jgi:predicted dithiol-disulfide oxidoreductase (DUF899 family)